MNPRYVITLARPQDLTRLPAIELAAARLLVGRAPESVLTETTSLDVLESAQRAGRLWVALADDVPVGFAHVEVIECGVARRNRCRPGARPPGLGNETGLAGV